jgi:hypothetical protein
VAIPPYSGKGQCPQVNAWPQHPHPQLLQGAYYEPPSTAVKDMLWRIAVAAQADVNLARSLDWLLRVTSTWPEHALPR